MTVPLEDRCYLCPLCDEVCRGVEPAAQHAGTSHPDATEITFLDLDDPKHMPSVSCEQALSGRKTASIVLEVVGVVAFLGCLVAFQRPQSPDARKTPAHPEG